MMDREKFYNLLKSGENVSVMVDFLVETPEQIDQLIDIGLNDPGKGSWRAIWVADRIHKKKPELIKPYLKQLIDALETLSSDGKLRHVLKLISLNKIPDAKLSFLLDFCTRELTNAARPVAIRVHAMQILYEISEAEPGLKPELIQIIEHEIELHPTAGIKSRGKKLLSNLYRQCQSAQ